MKKFTFVISLCFCVLNVFAQSPFQGRILYLNKFLLPNGQDITESASKIMGAQQDYYINANNYKSILNGQQANMQLYNSRDNKYYSIDGNKSAQIFDASTETAKIEKIEKLDGPFDILGRKCRGLIMTAGSVKTTYYYDESLKVNIQPFSKHKFGNWIDYLEASSGALPLAFIIESPQYTWKSEAIKVEEMKLDDSFFSLPADVKLKN
jgi:hypothetical protein